LTPEIFGAVIRGARGVGEARGLPPAKACNGPKTAPKQKHKPATKTSFFTMIFPLWQTPAGGDD
jgi:hypothetical protein